MSQAYIHRNILCQSLLVCYLPLYIIYIYIYGQYGIKNKNWIKKTNCLAKMSCFCWWAMTSVINRVISSWVCIKSCMWSSEEKRSSLALARRLFNSWIFVCKNWPTSMVLLLAYRKLDTTLSSSRIFFKSIRVWLDITCSSRI